jgi:hypothetical protein
MSVKIGFSTNPTNWLSRLIRWGTKSTVSHCFFITEWCGSQVMIEAHWNGLRVLDFKQWQKTKPGQLVAVVEPEVDLTPGFEALIPYLGQPYDFTGLAGMGIVMLVWGVLRRKINNPWDNHSAVFCSESVAQALSWAAYPGWTADAQNVTPDDLFQFFLKKKS